MAQKYPKHYVVLRDKQFDLGNNFTLDYDLTELYINGTFTMPYVETDNWNTTNLRKYDAVKIYFNYFNSASEAESASLSDMIKIFDGYIDGQPLSLDKTNGWQYQIQVKSRMGLSFERSTLTKIFTDTLQNTILRMLDQSDLNEWITDINIQGIRDNFRVNVDSSKYVGEVLQKLKEKYALHIFEDGENTLNIQTPFFLSQQNSIEAYEYNVENNIQSIDFGDKTNRVDTVICVGTNVVGIAFDPIAYQLKFGTQIENVQSNITPDPSKLNTRFIYRRDISNQQECQEIAREQLVDFAKNYTITFTTEFNPTQKIGEVFVLKNTNEVPESQLWIIKKISVNISKQGLYSTITGYSNSIVDFPEDLLLSSTGILDTDILQVTEKTTSALNLRD